MRTVVGHGLGNSRLLLKADDSRIGLRFHHAELARRGFDRNLQRGNGHIRVILFVKGDHLAVVHLIDVIARRITT